MPRDVAFPPQCKIYERRAAGCPGQRDQMLFQLLRFCGESIRFLLRNPDKTGKYGVGGKRRIKLWTCWLHLDKSELAEFLQCEVDFRRRDVSFVAQRIGVGDTLEHHCHQRSTLILTESQFG